MFDDYVVGWDYETVVEDLSFTFTLDGESVVAVWALVVILGEIAIDGGFSEVIKFRVFLAFTTLDGAEEIRCLVFGFLDAMM